MSMLNRLICYMATAALATLAAGCHRGAKATVAPPVRVQAILAQPSEVSMARTYSGTVEEASGSALSFSVAGTIRQVNVNVGDRVGRGQLIASLDPSTLQNAYEIAKATLNQAQDAYDRLKQLHDANSLPDMQWVEVQNALTQAKSSEAIARRSLNDAQLHAPVSGYVSEKMLDAGMNVAPGLPVVKVVDISSVKVSISVPENEVAEIAMNRDAVIKVGALGSREFAGRVSQKGVAANPLSRSYDIKITVPNPDAALLPGMICDVRLSDPTATKAMVLPINSVLLDSDNRNFVWVCRNGKAEKKIVKVDGMTDSGIVIAPGSIEGDSVITEGLQKVSQGTPVTIIQR